MSETHADARTDAIFRQQTFFACFATNGVETGGSEKLGIAETLRSGGERESEREMVGRWVGMECCFASCWTGCGWTPLPLSCTPHGIRCLLFSPSVTMRRASRWQGEVCLVSIQAQILQWFMYAEQTGGKKRASYCRRGGGDAALPRFRRTTVGHGREGRKTEEKNGRGQAEKSY